MIKMKLILIFKPLGGEMLAVPGRVTKQGFEQPGPPGTHYRKFGQTRFKKSLRHPRVPFGGTAS